MSYVKRHDDWIMVRHLFRHSCERHRDDIVAMPEIVDSQQRKSAAVGLAQTAAHLQESVVHAGVAHLMVGVRQRSVVEVAADYNRMTVLRHVSDYRLGVFSTLLKTFF